MSLSTKKMQHFLLKSSPPLPGIENRKPLMNFGKKEAHSLSLIEIL